LPVTPSTRISSHGSTAARVRIAATNPRTPAGAGASSTRTTVITPTAAGTPHTPIQNRVSCCAANTSPAAATASSSADPSRARNRPRPKSTHNSPSSSTASSGPHIAPIMAGIIALGGTDSGA
jgi:hypothetical protein